MTLAEFFGCSLLAFGPPLSMFIITVVHDPIRVIILIAASFFWLLSLLLSSILWFAVVPLRQHLAFGVVFSVIIQEVFRYIVYRILRKTEKGLQEVAENSRVTENKHILAYVSGLGFGITSGLFALVNVLADSAGPATVGIKGIGSENFFITSAAQTLCMIILHTCWNIIFFNALDTSRYAHLSSVLLSHMFVSCLTLLNKQQMYVATLLPNYIVTILMIILAYKVAGGTWTSFKKFISCK
uniref:Putative conserved plasma membrane protein n=1 Tax=Tabanus bromius TaxID=304241 RepID=A0A0K8TNE8_TABBR